MILFRLKNFLIALLFIYALGYSNDLDSIKIQLKWKHQFQFAGYYAAIEKGFFEEVGLAATLIERDFKNNTVNNIDAVVNGDVEYGVSDAGLLLSKYEQKPVVLLAQIFQHSPLVLLSKKESNIISPYEMIGKKVMYDTSDVQLRSMFQNTIGGKSKLDVISYSGNVETLIKGNVDVISSYLTNEPYFLKKRGVEINIISPQNYGVDFYGDNLFTSKKEIDIHPERVKNVIKAIVKGWEYALSNSDEIIEVIKSKYAIQKDIDHLRYEAKIISQMILADLIQVGHVDENRFNIIADTYFKSGLINSSDIPEDFFYYKYYKENTLLSEEEKLWLNNHPVLTVASDPAWEPYEFINKHGEYNGIAIDYLKKIENIIPVKFKYVKDVSWQELIELGKKQKVDIFSCITKTDERSQFLNFTSPYVSTPISIFSRIDIPYIGNLKNLKGKKVSVVEGYAIHELLKKNHPEITLIPVKNIQEAIEAVGDQRVFCFVGNQMTTSHYISKFGKTHIKVAGDTPYKNNLSIGVRKDWDILVGILQKALDQIDEKENLEILQNWVSVKYEHKFNLNLIWKLLGGSLAIISIFIIWNRLLKRQVEIRSRELSRSILNLHDEVDAKKKMMDALNKSERKFKAIYEQAPIGIAIMDSDTGKFLEMNHEYCRITGYTESELKEKTFMDITHEDDIQNNLNHMELLNKRSISTYEIEKRYYHKNGKIVWISLIVVPLWDDKNQSEHLAIIYDITYRKESEKQKKHLEKQLRETQKMEAIGTLAGGIAHDFNNILGAMLGFTEMALENLHNDEENKKRLEYVLQGGNRAKELIHQILTFSKEREGELKPLHIKSTIKEVLKLLRASIPSTIEIEDQLKSDSIILADATQIHQVIMNICTNAKFAMKDNGGILTIISEDVEMKDDSDFMFANLNSSKYMKISISDTGCGMDEILRSRIFEPFFTTRKKGEGSGLGLSVVHGIIHSYGGIIDVKSEIGKGSTFEIYLPIVEDESLIIEDKESNDTTIEKDEGNIFIVDDDKLMLEMFESLLVSFGYNVKAMSDPKEAWKHLKTNVDCYDLIISDITMPYITGDKLCSMYKTIDVDTPFILSTGFSEERPEVLQERCGAVATIKKPFNKSKVASIIKDIISKGRSENNKNGDM